MNESLKQLRNSLDASNCHDWRIVQEDGGVIVVSPGGHRWRAVADVEDESIWNLTRLEEP